MKEAVIVSTARTGIGRAFKGALNATRSPTMMGHAIRHAVDRAGVDPAQIDDAVIGTVLAPEPDYFPEAYQLFPVFPSDRSREITALVLGIVGLLIMPKFAILAQAVIAGRARAFGGGLRALRSVVVEILLTSALAPVMLMFQSRAVLQVLSGQDGGWPANARGEGALTRSEAARASRWIVLSGAIAFVATWYLAPDLLPWLLPLTLPMLGAPLLISWTSQPVGAGVFGVPVEAEVPPVVASYRAIHARWSGADATDETAPIDGVAHVMV